MAALFCLASACREFADQPDIQDTAVNKIASCSPEVSTVSIDLDEDGTGDLLFDAYNYDNASIGSKDRGIFLNRTSAQYKVELLFVPVSPGYVLNSSYLLGRVDKGTSIGPGTTYEGVSWRDIEYGGNFNNNKHLIWDVYIPTVGFWYFNTLTQNSSVVETYIAFRYKSSGGGTFRYGWIRIRDERVPGEDVQRIRVVDMARATIPGTPVMAGVYL